MRHVPPVGLAQLLAGVVLLEPEGQAPELLSPLQQGLLWRPLLVAAESSLLRRTGQGFGGGRREEENQGPAKVGRKSEITYVDTEMKKASQN